MRNYLLDIKQIDELGVQGLSQQAESAGLDIHQIEWVCGVDVPNKTALMIQSRTDMVTGHNALILRSKLKPLGPGIQ